MSTGRFFEKGSQSQNSNVENDVTEYLKKLSSEYKDLINEKNESQNQAEIARIESEVILIYSNLKSKREPLVAKHNELVIPLMPIVRKNNQVIKVGDTYQIKKTVEPTKKQRETNIKAVEPIDAQIGVLVCQIKLIESLFPNLIRHTLDSPSSRINSFGR